MNVLKVLSKTKWGADGSTLMNLYRTMVCSKLDYGRITYRSARKSCIQLLHAVHHQGIRLCASLCAEANEPSLEIRRLKLALYKGYPNKGNPAYSAVPSRQQYIDPPGSNKEPKIKNVAE